MKRCEIEIEIEELERRWQAGEPVSSLARRYGVSWSHIYRIKRKFGLDVLLKNASVEPSAPTSEDDDASQASILLSPWVQRRVDDLRAAGVIEGLFFRES